MAKALIRKLQIVMNTQAPGKTTLPSFSKASNVSL